MQLTQVLVLAVVLCTLLENVGGFVTPSTAVPALSKARHTKTARGRVHRATSTADPSSSSSQSDWMAKNQNDSAGKVIGDSTRQTRHLIRDAIWKATDALAKSAEELPERKIDQSVQRLGVLLDNIDDKYFAKYRGAGSGLNAAAGSSGGTAAVAGGQKVGGDKKATGATAAAATAGGAVAAVASKTKSATKKAVESASSKTSEPVKLDRPKQVQGVFDELQKKAVEYYKSTATTEKSKSPAPAAGFATPLPPAMAKLESEVEALLAGAKFKPKALSKAKKTLLVDALKAMEDGYPETASPLGDSAFPGEWSVVYSSSGNLVRRALKGFLSRLVKVSEGRQSIRPRTSSVVDSCRARLRWTPFGWRVTRTGAYKSSTAGGERANRKVEVQYRENKPGLLRRLLPRLETGGTVQAEVTYLSNRWRICRSAKGDVAVAFRKIDGDK